ncbi:glutamate N-acetyltransferase [Bacillus sp. JCM 19045]|nr:glutamate N-acetyltransferase [Bacillus sp. JCM 19045]
MAVNQLMSEIKTINGGTITDVKGFKAAGVHCGLKRKRLDLGAIVCEVPASAAAVYTMNQIKAAPLLITKESLSASAGKLQAIVVNSGNANACTGQQGMQDALEMQKQAANHFQIQQDYVAVTSTGVIGELLPMEKLRNGISNLSVDSTSDAFAEAILTTDTCTKEVCVELMINNKKVKIAGVAKGSGMIHPNMATMLGFITTDAAIESSALQQILAKATDETFNRITVDGDTSTNDMVIAMASGLADNEKLTDAHPDWQIFYEGFKHCAVALAKMIARDGEGATKLIEVQVDGAVNDTEAGKIAKTVVGSDLVKTAIYGKDANWGRIICAIGYSECSINPQTIDISIGIHQTLKNSSPVSFSEEAITAYMNQEETIVIHVQLNNGHGTGKAWGCDLTYDYVRINAGYRT